MDAADGEFLFKAITTGVVGSLFGAVAWLVRTVIGLRETQIEHKGTLALLEGKVEDVSNDQISKEDVRAAIKEAFAERDKQVVERRESYDKLHKMELKEAVREELETARPKIVKDLELRLRAGDSGSFKTGDHRG